MRFFKITREILPRWQEKLEALEQLSVYPLGADAFRLTHGADYFAFFERMGEVHYYAIEEGGALAAVACGVLRPASVRAPRRWYAADLKVHPAFRGRHLPITLLRRAFLQNWLRCGRGYAVAMDPSDGRVPPGVRLMAHFKWIPMSLMALAKIDVYAADEHGMKRAAPLIARGGVRPRYVSLAGVKDLVLESSKAPLDLLHVSFAPTGDDRVYEAPQRGATHMWCVPREHALAGALAAEGFTPTASATLLHHRLARMDWATLETCEI